MKILGVSDISNALAPSSSGLGHRPLTAVTRIRIPSGSQGVKSKCYNDSMGIKSWLIKKALTSKLKGVPAEKIDELAKEIENNPELMKSLKALEDNKEVKSLLEKVQKEVEEKIKNGMNAEMAQMSVMMKYKDELIKHQDALAPLMQLMGGNFKI